MRRPPLTLLRAPGALLIAASLLWSAPALADLTTAPTHLERAPGLTRAVLGASFSCGIVAGGARCWEGIEVSRSWAIALPGAVTQVGSNGDYGCALTDAGQVWCWEQRVGEVKPWEVVGARGVTEIVVSAWDLYGLQADGAALHQSLTRPAEPPRPVAFGAPAETLFARGGEGVCGWVTTGRVECVVPGSEARAFTGWATRPARFGEGMLEVCAVGADGVVACAYGGEPERVHPVEETVPDPVGVSGWIGQRCVWNAAGAIACAGVGLEGTLQLEPLEGAAAALLDVSVTGEHVCALRDGGWLQCWEVSIEPLPTPMLDEGYSAPLQNHLELGVGLGGGSALGGEAYFASSLRGDLLWFGEREIGGGAFVELDVDGSSGVGARLGPSLMVTPHLLLSADVTARAATSRWLEAGGSLYVRPFVSPFRGDFFPGVGLYGDVHRSLRGEARWTVEGGVMVDLLIVALAWAGSAAFM